MLNRVARSQFALNARKIVCVVRERRRLNLEKIFLDGLIRARVISKRHRDFRGGLFGREMPRDFFLRRNENRQVAFNDGLACKCVAGFDVARGQSQRRASPHLAVFDDNGAASAASLSAARNVDVNPSIARGVENQRAVT